MVIEDELDIINDHLYHGTPEDSPTLAVPMKVLDTLRLYRKLILDGAPIDMALLNSFDKDLYEATKGDKPHGDTEYVDNVIDAILDIKDLHAY
jgi:hypothetical protein